MAEWQPNLGGTRSDAFYAAFRQRFTQPQDNDGRVRLQLMVEMLAAAVERAGSTEAADVARALEGASSKGSSLSEWHRATLRADDHQLQ